jgi:hypothetical protein
VYPRVTLSNVGDDKKIKGSEVARYIRPIPCASAAYKIVCCCSISSTFLAGGGKLGIDYGDRRVSVRAEREISTADGNSCINIQ